MGLVGEEVAAAAEADLEAAAVAALGAEMVARGRAPGQLDFPADSSMPITTVSA